MVDMLDILIKEFDAGKLTNKKLDKFLHRCLKEDFVKEDPADKSKKPLGIRHGEWRYMI